MQSYSLNKFSGLKINAQILNDAIGVLEKMFKHISLHTDTYTHAQISCTPLITLSLQIPLLSISRTGFLFFFPFKMSFRKITAPINLNSGYYLGGGGRGGRGSYEDQKYTRAFIV